MFVDFRESAASTLDDRNYSQMMNAARILNLTRRTLSTWARKNTNSVKQENACQPTTPKQHIKLHIVFLVQQQSERTNSHLTFKPFPLDQVKVR